MRTCEKSHFIMVCIFLVRKLSTIATGKRICHWNWFGICSRTVRCARRFTHLNCVFGESPYKCYKIFYTILCFVFVTICMQASNGSPIPMTSAVCPCDCKLSKRRVMLCPVSVCCMKMTRLPISSYHHPPFAVKFPHIMANGLKSIRRALCRSLFWFRQECQARRRWSN